jgi:hypothetical protein
MKQGAKQMFKISYTVNGRTAAPDRFANELGREVARSAIAMTQRKIASIRCPVHNQTARIAPGASGSKFQLQACCERLMGKIRRQLR